MQLHTYKRDGYHSIHHATRARCCLLPLLINRKEPRHVANERVVAMVRRFFCLRFSRDGSRWVANDAAFTTFTSRSRRCAFVLVAAGAICFLCFLLTRGGYVGGGCNLLLCFLLTRGSCLLTLIGFGLWAARCNGRLRVIVGSQRVRCRVPCMRDVARKRVRSALA